MLEREACEKLGMGLFLGVSQGSDLPPKLLHMTYTPPGGAAARKLALVGKGLTFDRCGWRGWQALAAHLLTSEANQIKCKTKETGDALQHMHGCPLQAQVQASLSAALGQPVGCVPGSPAYIRPGNAHCSLPVLCLCSGGYNIKAQGGIELMKVGG